MADLTEQSQQGRFIGSEIARIVAKVCESGSILDTGRHAALLFALYPGANFPVGHIIDELVIAAAAARVPVEISRSHPESS